MNLHMVVVVVLVVCRMLGTETETVSVWSYVESAGPLLSMSAPS